MHCCTTTGLTIGVMDNYAHQNGYDMRQNVYANTEWYQHQQGHYQHAVSDNRGINQGYSQSGRAYCSTSYRDSTGSNPSQGNLLYGSTPYDSSRAATADTTGAQYSKLIHMLYSGAGMTIGKAFK